MPDAPFKKGDVVEVKSGGPEMTVEAIDSWASGGGWQVHTIWFTETSFARLAVDADVLQHSAGTRL